MTERIQKTNRKAFFLALALYLCAFLCLLFGSVFTGIRAFWQIMAAGTAVAGIQLTQRYLLSAFEYILTPDDELAERNTLTVVRIQGKKRTVLGNLSLAFPCTLEKDLTVRQIEKKHGRVSRIFNFLADIAPAHEYGLLVEFREETVLCRLQCSEQFAEALRIRACGCEAADDLPTGA